MTLRISLAGALICGVGFMLSYAAPSLADPPAFAPAGDDRDPVLAVVGDVACQPGAPVETEKAADLCTTGRWEAQTATANQIEAMQPDLVALLGDQQYQDGYYQDYLNSFDHTYGAFKWLQRPSPGNHEFYTSKGESGAAGYGYFDYYNGYEVNPMTGQAQTTSFVPVDSVDHMEVTQPTPRQDGQAGHFGDSGNGWYSYNVGHWHIISLNIECAVQTGGCDPSQGWLKSETDWLAADLAQNTAPCTVAYWHQPTFSAGNAAVGNSKFTTAEGQAADAWWQLLYQHGADLVLNGHDHLYARYAPMDPNGNRNPTRGIREFIVGTGGESLDAVTQNNNTPNLERATGGFYGVMKLTLHPGGYDWDYEPTLDANFQPASEANFIDKGSAFCHRSENSQGNQN